MSRQSLAQHTVLLSEKSSYEGEVVSYTKLQCKFNNTLFFISRFPALFAYFLLLRRNNIDECLFYMLAPALPGQRHKSTF